MFRLIRCLTFSNRTCLTVERLEICVRNLSVFTKHVSEPFLRRRAFHINKRTRTDRPRGKERSKEDYDYEIDVSKHIQVFSNPRKQYHNGMIMLCLAPGTIGYYLAAFSFYYFRDEGTFMESLRVWDNPVEWISKNMYRVIRSATFLLLGFIGMVVGLRHPCRCIRQIWLLKGGQQFRIVTFSPISIGRHFKKIIDVPLKDVSGQVARDPNVKSIPIKVKGFKRPFLLDNKLGTFHNVKLYDYTIGQKAKFR